MNELMKIAIREKIRLGEEYDRWKQTEDEGKGAAPVHEQHWHAIRLLMVAAEHGGFGVLTEPQVKHVYKYINIPLEIIGVYTPRTIPNKRALAA